MKLVCPVCNRGVEDGPLYRVNPKGEKGVFKHEKCGGKPGDPEVKRICEIIDKDGDNGSRGLTP